MHFRAFSREKFVRKKNFKSDFFKNYAFSRKIARRIFCSEWTKESISRHILTYFGGWKSARWPARWKKKRCCSVLGIKFIEKYRVSAFKWRLKRYETPKTLEDWEIWVRKRKITPSKMLQIIVKNSGFFKKLLIFAYFKHFFKKRIFLSILK